MLKELAKGDDGSLSDIENKLNLDSALLQGIRKAEEDLAASLEAKGVNKETIQSLVENVALAIKSRGLNSQAEIQEYIRDDHKINIAAAGVIPAGAVAMAEALGFIVASPILLELAAIAAIGTLAYGAHTLLKEKLEEKDETDKDSSKMPSSPDPDQDPDDSKEQGKFFREAAKETVHQLIDKLNIEEHEGGKHGGHAVDRHVGKDLEWLKDRVDNDPGSRGRGIGSATSFPDLETANEVTKEVLRQNTDKIVEWIQSKDAQKGIPQGFSADIKKNIGFGINKNGIKRNDISRAVVVLRLIKSEIKVFTSYPEYK